MYQTGEILYKYLNDIIHNPTKAHLDVSSLPEEFKKLGEELEFLAECNCAQLRYMEALSNGYISAGPPDVRNAFYLPLKELHNLIMYMINTSKGVSEGDYSLRINASGELIDAFNDMIQQIEERATELIAEKKLVEQKNLEIKRNNQLMQSLANDTDNMILVFSRDTGEQFFINNSAKRMAMENPFMFRMLTNKLINHKTNCGIGPQTWEIQLTPNHDGDKQFYVVESFCSTTEEQTMIIHILNDDTNRKKYESLNQIDPLTELHNKSYAINTMEKYLSEGIPFLVTFVDVDYLKYCNDKYGHENGDNYLIRVSDMLRTLECDVSRIGGDEFLLVKQGTNQADFDKKLFETRRTLSDTGSEPYPKSFSFGTCAVPVNPSAPLGDFLKCADDTMYQFKTIHKKPIVDNDYKDTRI